MHLLQSISEWLFPERSKQGTTSSGDVHAKRGIKAFRMRNYDVAKEELGRAIKMGVTKCDLAEVYMYLGKVHERLNEFDEAIETYEKALEINPNYCDAWNNLGIAHFYLGDLDEAERCHEKALSIEPEYAFALGSLGAVYIRRNDPRKAIGVLERAIALMPDKAAAHENIALAYAMAGRFEEAEASLKQAVTLGGTDWRIIRERIDGLKALKQGIDAERTVTREVDWLPSRCSNCSAPVSVSTVNWTSPTTADCSYCGTNLEKPIKG